MSTSTKLKKRFCKDNNISITIFRSPYFESRLELLGKTQEYKAFIEMVKEHFNGSEEQYLEYYNNIKESIINFIKESDTFRYFNNTDMNKYACNYNIIQSDVYKVPNIGHNFISIDMKKANFSSLVYFGKEVNLEFFGSYDWEEFMKQFTDIEYFYKSKYIRQVVFGNCNPKRQVTYEKYLMAEKVLHTLLNLNIVSYDRIYSMCSDEIIINIDDLTENEISKIHNIVHCISEQTVPLRSTEFKLGKIVNSKAYIKHIVCEDGEKVDKTELKCLEPLEAPFVIRALRDELPEEEDFYFVIDDKLARLTEAPYIGITYTTLEVKRNE